MQTQNVNNVMYGGDVERITTLPLGDLLLLTMRIHGESVLQVDAETGEENTGVSIVNRSIALAEFMKQRGVGPGDSVSISAENRLEWVHVPAASFLIGATFAPLNPEYTPVELDHIINLSKPKVMFVVSRTYKHIFSVLDKHPSIRTVVYIGKSAMPADLRHARVEIVSYEAIVKGVRIDEVDEEYEATPIDPVETVATILCSSGTTGMPKGVMCTHDNMTTYVDVLKERAQEVLDGQGGRISTFGITPFFHSLGFMSLYLNLLGGSLCVLLRKFRARLFLESIQKYRVTTLVVPPPVLLVLTKHPLARQFDLSSLRDIRSGAAPMSREMELDIRDRFKVYHVSQGYGMTETTLGVLANSYHNFRPGSVGTLVKSMYCKVVDGEGRALGPHEEGELCFKGPLIMKGYVNNAQATRDTIDADGWLHTGDVAYYDRDGFFYIVDRIKELIKYKAFQVAPAELEGILLTHPAVADVAVIGLPDEDSGELPMAFVVRKAGAQVEPRELQEFVAAKVSRQKKLRGGVRFIDEIPKNPTGKILRRALKQQAVAMQKAKL